MQEQNIETSQDITDEQQQPKSKHVITISVIAIIIVIVAVGGWFFRDRIISLIPNLPQTPLEKQVTTLNLQLNQQSQQIKKLQTQLSSQSSGINQQNDTIFIGQIYYLIKTANFYLTVQRNIPLTLKDLNMANRLTTKIANSASANKLNAALTINIQALKQSTLANKSSVVNTLETLNQQLEQFKDSKNMATLANKQIASTQTIKSNNSTQTLPIWRQIADKIGAAFAKAVTVRRNEQNVKALLSREQAMVLVTQMQCRLLAAEPALFHQRFDLFNQELAQVSKTLSSYFGQYPNATYNAIQTQLKKLQAMNIAAPKINLQASLQAIEEVMQQAS